MIGGLAKLSSIFRLVAFILAGFGGFLVGIAPPIEILNSFSVGVLGFSMTICLLALEAAQRTYGKSRMKPYWITLGLVLLASSLFSGIWYSDLLDRYTYPKDVSIKSRIIGSDSVFYTERAQHYLQANPDSSVAEVFDAMPDDAIWTAEGIAKSRRELMIAYLCFALSSASAAFCLAELTTLARSGAYRGGSKRS